MPTFFLKFFNLSIFAIQKVLDLFFPFEPILFLTVHDFLNTLNGSQEIFYLGFFVSVELAEDSDHVHYDGIQRFCQMHHGLPHITFQIRMNLVGENLVQISEGSQQRTQFLVFRIGLLFEIAAL